MTCTDLNAWIDVVGHALLTLGACVVVFLIIVAGVMILQGK